MKVIVYSEEYPSEQNVYGDVFVHVRVKEYTKYCQPIVVALKPNLLPLQYIFDGIEVNRFSEKEKLIEFVNSQNPDVVLLHFYLGWMFNKWIKKSKYPFVIWAHGYEAMSWKRRAYHFTFARIYLSYIQENIKQMKAYRELIEYSNKTNRVKFVFVSEWLKKINSIDTGVSPNCYNIIPNPINNHHFVYNGLAEKRNEILVIKSFHYIKKYSVDLVIKSLLELSRMPTFNEFNITIYGDGGFWETVTSPLKKYKNIKLNKTFIPFNNIPAVHKTAGILLCPSRMDTQGVSMCEAMSSGLVPITSKVAAIPEFVEHFETGILTNNKPIVIAEAINYLFQNPEKYIKMSEQASLRIIEKCGINMIIDKEMEFLKSF